MILFKRIFLIAICGFTFNAVKAQLVNINDFDKFSTSFPKNISYPNDLVNNCKLTMCIFKIDINATGNISDMQLSDSADSLFRKEFNEKKHNLDTTAFKRYIKKNYQENTAATYIIPLFYSLFNMPCPPDKIDFAILKNYYKFGDKILNGDVTVLKEMNYKINIQQ